MYLTLQVVLHMAPSQSPPALSRARATALLPCSWNRLEHILTCAKEGLPLSWTPVIHPSVSLKSSPQSKLTLSSNSCLGDADGLFTTGKALGRGRNRGCASKVRTQRGRFNWFIPGWRVTNVTWGGIYNLISVVKLPEPRYLIIWFQNKENNGRWMEDLNNKVLFTEKWAMKRRRGQ